MDRQTEQQRRSLSIQQKKNAGRVISPPRIQHLLYLGKEGAEFIHCHTKGERKEKSTKREEQATKKKEKKTTYKKLYALGLFYKLVYICSIERKTNQLQGCFCGTTTHIHASKFKPEK